MAKKPKDDVSGQKREYSMYVQSNTSNESEPWSANALALVIASGSHASVGGQ